MMSAKVVSNKFLLNYLTNVYIGANSVDSDQTAPTGAVWSVSTPFVEKASKTFQQMTRADDFILCIDHNCVFIEKNQKNRKFNIMI